MKTASNALSKKFNFEFGDISEEEDKQSETEIIKDVAVEDCEDDDDAFSVDINMDDINVWI